MRCPVQLQEKVDCTLDKIEQLLLSQIEIVISRRDAFCFSKGNETSDGACLRYTMMIISMIYIMNQHNISKSHRPIVTKVLFREINSRTNGSQGLQ